jgi:hypothetical protein
VTVKVVDVRVAQLIVSLNVALSTWLRGTPLALFRGIVEVTAGVGVIVVKVHTYLAGSSWPCGS